MATYLEVILTICVLLLIVIIVIAYRRGLEKGKIEAELIWQENLVRIRSDIADKQRAGIKGKVSEAFAPFLKGFPFKASECKFIGDPIDYLVFEGLDERDIKGIHFVEVKSGVSKLSKHQKQIKDLIDSAGSDKINFKTFGFDELE